MRISYGDGHVIVEFHQNDTTLEFAKAVMKVLEWIGMNVDVRVEEHRVKITLRGWG